MDLGAEVNWRRRPSGWGSHTLEFCSLFQGELGKPRTLGLSRLEVRRLPISSRSRAQGCAKAGMGLLKLFTVIHWVHQAVNIA